MQPTSNLDANRAVHAEEAAVFEEIHPELFSPVERRLIDETVMRVRRCATASESVQVLDIAAGTGRLTLPFLAAGCMVTAIDASEEMLEQLSGRVPAADRARLETLVCDAGTFLVASGEQYDAIVMGAFLHHVCTIEELINRASARLAIGGYLCIIHDPVLRRPLARIAGRWLERLDSLLFQLWYLMTRGRLIPRLKEYGSADLHTKRGIDDDQVRRTVISSGCDIIKHERYYSHKTRCVTWLDRQVTKWLPQFYILARKVAS